MSFEEEIDRISKELHAELAEPYVKRIAKLEKALHEIAEHPHCDETKWYPAYTQGHQCAAKIARAVLDEDES